MLTATPYPDMHDGPELLVSGELLVDGRWHVSVFLHQRADGRWRVGRETDSEIYTLNHLHVSVPARAGCHRVPSKTQRRELLQQVYQWIDQETGMGSTSQTQPDRQMRTNPMPIIQCAVYTRHGHGPRCTKQAAIGQEICKTHVFLESKLGTLPRQPVVEPPAPTPEPAIARATPDAVTEADFAAPTEVPAEALTEVPTAPVEGQEPKVRKTRRDKGTPRKRN